MKVLDLNKNVATLVKEYPEIKEIMVELGFKDITSPVALQVMGRVMTIPKGAQVKGIAMDKIIDAFTKAGFEVIHAGNETKAAPAESAPVEEGDRVGMLKNMITRVGNGESVEDVRKDFVKHFESVSVHEIVDAEQSLINDGMPVQEVQKLCDLHSALFHGKTEAEIWEEEEAQAAAKDVVLPEGHPVRNLRKENEELEKIINDAESSLIAGDLQSLQKDFDALKKVRTLYGKKEELIMPVLDTYGVHGPSDVMWGVDNEIKSEASRIARELHSSVLSSLKQDILKLTARMREMLYKEEKILFPLAIENFTKEQWYAVYEDLPEMGCVYTDSYETWPEAEEYLKEQKSKEDNAVNNGVVKFDGGELTLAQLKALFKLLPIDITFINENDINSFYANEAKIFSRPKSSLGRKVYDCHPVFVRPIVTKMIKQFKSGELDSYERWIPNRPVRILYLPVRDPNGKYLGTAEIIQDLTFAKEHFAK
jgi:DUF438 domain-containing protein